MSRPTRTIHGVPHLECRDCGDLQPHYDIVSCADGHFCRRCADVNEAASSTTGASGTDVQRRFVQVTVVGTAIRVNGRNFTVTEIRDGKGRDAGRPVYILSGKRGARYATCRNVKHPEMMFLVDERGFGIPAGWERVWLSDASGALVAGVS